MAARIPISAGNWKMYLIDAEADDLCNDLLDSTLPIQEIAGVEVVLAPAFLQLPRVSSRFAGTGVGIAGQNMHAQPQGAFTGEVSPTQLRDVASWVILGHSERRQYFGETDVALQMKVAAALSHGLRPILCVGERLDERQAGQMQTVLTQQVTAALDGIDLPDGFVIAYEPVWAIGTGKAATAEQAQTAAATIRGLVAGLAGIARADSLCVLYGGSVKPDNVAAFAAQPDVDGALVGGAARDAAAFLAITQAIASAKQA